MHVSILSPGFGYWFIQIFWNLHFSGKFFSRWVSLAKKERKKETGSGDFENKEGEIYTYPIIKLLWSYIKGLKLQNKEEQKTETTQQPKKKPKERVWCISTLQVFNVVSCLLFKTIIFCSFGLKCGPSCLTSINTSKGTSRAPVALQHPLEPKRDENAQNFWDLCSRLFRCLAYGPTIKNVDSKFKILALLLNWHPDELWRHKGKRRDTESPKDKIFALFKQMEDLLWAQESQRQPQNATLEKAAKLINTVQVTFINTFLAFMT